MGGDLECGFETNFRYGHPLGPFGAIALSMPELPGEKASEMARMCIPPFEGDEYPEETRFQGPSRDSDSTEAEMEDATCDDEEE